MSNLVGGLMFARKYVHRVQAFLMSVLMVTLMTFVITAINTGFSDGFISRWGKGLIIAWPIAFAIILIAGRRVQQLAIALCQKD